MNFTSHFNRLSGLSVNYTAMIKNASGFFFIKYHESFLKIVLFKLLIHIVFLVHRKRNFRFQMDSSTKNVMFNQNSLCIPCCYVKTLSILRAIFGKLKCITRNKLLITLRYNDLTFPIVVYNY